MAVDTEMQRFCSFCATRTLEQLYKMESKAQDMKAWGHLSLIEVEIEGRLGLHI